MAARWLKKQWGDFLRSLGDRYHRVLQIVDEALASDDFKEKKWAVDLIMKGQEWVESTRRKTAGKAPTAVAPAVRPSPSESVDISLLRDEELIQRIHESLKSWETPESAGEPDDD